MELDLRAILDKIKKNENLNSDKELAQILNIDYNTLRGRIQRNSIPFEILFQYISKNQLDLNELFFDKNVKSDNSPALTALNNAVAVSENEVEVADYLKKYTISKIFTKLFPKNTTNPFYKKLLDIVFPKTQRIVLFLYKILKHLSDMDIKNIDVKISKNLLIKQIQDFDLLSFENLGHGFTNYDKNKLISLIENLNDEEAYMIIKNASDASSELKEYLDFLNKISY